MIHFLSFLLRNFRGAKTSFRRDSKLMKDRVLSIVLNRGGYSDHFIDGKRATKTKIRDVVEGYNIQVK